MSTFEVKLRPQPQILSTTFPNGVTYQLKLLYQWNDDNCWILDFYDRSGNSILCGVPLIAGVDLLAQHQDLGFGCSLYAAVDGDKFANPDFFGLGIKGHLYVVT